MRKSSIAALALVLLAGTTVSRADVVSRFHGAGFGVLNPDTDPVRVALTLDVALPAAGRGIGTASVTVDGRSPVSLAVLDAVYTPGAPGSFAGTALGTDGSCWNMDVADNAGPPDDAVDEVGIQVFTDTSMIGDCLIFGGVPATWPNPGSSFVLSAAL